MSETRIRTASLGKCCGLLVAAIAISLAACAGKEKVSTTDVEYQAFQDLRTTIREVIGDPARQTEVIELVDVLEVELGALRKSVSERRQGARRLNANYDTPRADFEAFIEQGNQEIRSSHERVLDQHRLLLRLVTPDEWSEISKPHTKAMKATVKSLQAI